MSTDQPMGADPDEEREPTPEEIAAAFVHRLGRVPVRDVVLQTMATMTDVAGIRLGLGPEGDTVRDLDQARLAIEALRALLGVADAEIGTAASRPFREPLASLQMAYARLAEGGGQAPGGEPGGPPPDDPASRLWVPGR